MVLQIWIDNDACPKVARELIFAAAQRKSIAVKVVANNYSKIPLNDLFESICVPGGFDVADDYIAENAASGDLVITSDVILAGRVVAKGAVALNTQGTIFDARTIGEQLATRNLLNEMRGGGLVTGGPPPYGPAQKKAFADSLDRLVTKMSNLTKK